MVSFDPKDEYLPTAVLTMSLLTVVFCWMYFTYLNVETQSQGRLKHHASATTDYLIEYTSTCGRLPPTPPLGALHCPLL